MKGEARDHRLANTPRPRCAAWRRAATPVALALALVASAARPALHASPAAAQVGAQAETARSWEALLIRDQRVQFNRGARIAALATLDDPSRSSVERAAALYALGAGGCEGERDRLLTALVQGDARSRCAALLALGELSSGDLTSLGQMAKSDDLETSGCAVLALLRSGRPSARTFAEEFARGDSQAARQAADLIVFHVDRTASRETPIARRLLDLRWDAATRFGLVDGENWTILTVRELCANEAFLDQLVYSSVADSLRQGVHDYLLEVLTTRPGESVLRASVRAMPGALGDLVSANLWTPADAESWRIVLEEIERHDLELASQRLLRKALDDAASRWRASLLLLRSGDKTMAKRLEADLGTASIDDKARLLDALGASHDLNQAAWIERLEDKQDVRLHASAIVARFLIGARGGEDELRAVLDERGSDDPLRGAVIESLTRQADYGEVWPYLSRLSTDGRLSNALEVNTAMVERGRVQGREALRNVVREDPTSALAVDCLRALCVQPSFEDLALVRELFPQPGALELNQILAVTLVRQKDALCLPLLRAALWRQPSSRSILAAALIADAAGMEMLQSELLTPPSGITERDLRRVGFALGVWGGLDQVHWLSQRQGAGDPGLQGALLGALGARTY